MTAIQPLFHAPLYEALMDLHRSIPISYHVPGHKYGQSLNKLQKLDTDAAQKFQAIMALDVTELSVTDDLHMPTSVIAAAQRLAAATFGAEQTYFLVGGSTAGNLAMIMASCKPGDLIILQRNVHKSVLNGLMLAQARAVFLSPQTDPGTGLHAVPKLSDIEAALLRYPEAKAVFLTNPSYYGLSTDLEPYAKLVHSHDCLLLVDEAHGAHYGMHPSFPRSALQAGADAVVQSTHKTLSALTMGAMLHVKGIRIDRDALGEALSMVQSSSPSYPIMASLDIARAMIDTFGPSLFEEGIMAAESFRQWANESSGWIELPAYGLNMMGDPLRIVMKDRAGLLSGYDLQKMLEKRGCWPEMADSIHVVLLFGMSMSFKDNEKLIQACIEIGKEVHTGTDFDMVNQRSYVNEAKIKGSMYDTVQSISEPVLFSRKRIQRDQVEMINITEAAGRIAAEAVIPYPPGIPILYSGERIYQNVALYMKELGLMGAKCQGISDPTLKTIMVIREA